MTILAYLMLFGIVPVGLMLFACYPPRRAALLTLFGGWMFLPMAILPISGFLDFSKMMAACGTTLLGMALFDRKSLLSIRFRWFDLPILFFCFWPGACAIVNGFGIWECVSAIAHYMSMWGVPYLVGKAYFADEKGMHYLTIAFIIAGLVYVPFCLFEVRFSPQLHRMFYGYHQHSFAQTYRLGGWRPMVFMQHGIQVALWMVLSSLCGFWMWWTKQLPQRMEKRPLLFLIPLWITTILTRSTGALALGILALSITVAGRAFSSRWIYLPLLLIAPLWVSLRTTELFSGEIVGQLGVAVTGDEERDRSMQARLNQENMTRREALQSPIFGHGRRGPGLDQLWLLEFRNHGIPQLVALLVLLNLPLAVAVYRCSGRELAQRQTAGLLMTLIPAVFMLDSLLNAMPTPVYCIACGASVSYFGARRQAYQRVDSAASGSPFQIVTETAALTSGPPNEPPEAPAIRRRLVPGRLL